MELRAQSTVMRRPIASFSFRDSFSSSSSSIEDESADNIKAMLEYKRCPTGKQPLVAGLFP
jgi:hypothetical protein